MERHYTILLDRAGRSAVRPYESRSSLAAAGCPARGLPADPPQPAIHREWLTAPELEELAEEPDFVAAAEVMCTGLLGPVAEEEVFDPGLVARSGRRQQTWGVRVLEADSSKFTGADVTVAVLDTGIDAGHEAFRGVDLVEKDFTGYGNGDTDGHGTHCAGVLFGRSVDGVRIGVAPGVRTALIGKIIGPDGGDSDMLIRGLCWAHELGARVVSMSVGLDFAATVEARIAEGWPRRLGTAVTLEAYRANLRLIERLLQMLSLQEPCTGGVVAAAGDDSSRGANGEFVMSPSPPAQMKEIVSVGAIDPDHTGTGRCVSTFSNGGVTITAPGRGIVSARAGGGLTALSGTSAAAPHVAGTAALWWQAVRQSDLPANATLVRGKLLQGAEDMGFSPAVFPAERGAGLAKAPQDGIAVAAHRQLIHTMAPEPPNLRAIALRERARRLSPGAAPEPIALGHGGEKPAWPRQRRVN